MGICDRWDQAVIFQRQEHVAADLRPDAESGVSGRPELGYSESPMALFREDFYVSPMAGSSSLSWSFALT